MKAANLFDIRGHVAIVTGAASGLGLAYAEVLAENGAKLTLVDMDAEGLAKVAARLMAAGADVTQAVLDIGETEKLQRVIDDTATRNGRLDIAFANAGGSAGPGFALTPAGSIDEADLATFDRWMEINFRANYLTIRFAATPMKKQRRGSIIATSSIAGIKSDPLVSYGYVAAKAAINNIVRHAAVDLAPYNVRVNAIAPGPFYTNIAGGRLRRDPEQAKKFAAMIPMARIGEPDEIKGLALLLASPAGSYITGAVIPIDGGTTAK
jgi:NAD(P)-dependent dehydrogenase (short-subunit alcohol dehydrogenase family)